MAIYSVLKHFTVAKVFILEKSYFIEVNTQTRHLPQKPSTKNICLECKKNLFLSVQKKKKLKIANKSI